MLTYPDMRLCGHAVIPQEAFSHLLRRIIPGQNRGFVGIRLEKHQNTCKLLTWPKGTSCFGYHQIFTIFKVKAFEEGDSCSKGVKSQWQKEIFSFETYTVYDSKVDIMPVSHYRPYHCVGIDSWFYWVSLDLVAPFSLRKASMAAADSVILIIHWLRAACAAFAVLDSTDCPSSQAQSLFNWKMILEIDGTLMIYKPYFENLSNLQETVCGSLLLMIDCKDSKVGCLGESSVIVIKGNWSFKTKQEVNSLYSEVEVWQLLLQESSLNDYKLMDSCQVLLIKTIIKTPVIHEFLYAVHYGYNSYTVCISLHPGIGNSLNCGLLFLIFPNDTASTEEQINKVFENSSLVNDSIFLKKPTLLLTHLEMNFVQFAKQVLFLAWQMTKLKTEFSNL
ncbi:hypothetical protein MJT46_008486 [Ovis ammon polii x Ovis aries]|nr:hypothetical protein MJT46_008486 [Ovis ammon polii x Ovis aries]